MNESQKFFAILIASIFLVLLTKSGWAPFFGEGWIFGFMLLSYLTYNLIYELFGKLW